MEVVGCTQESGLSLRNNSDWFFITSIQTQNPLVSVNTPCVHCKTLLYYHNCQ